MNIFSLLAFLAYYCLLLAYFFSFLTFWMFTLTCLAMFVILGEELSKSLWFSISYGKLLISGLMFLPAGYCLL